MWLSLLTVFLWHNGARGSTGVCWRLLAVLLLTTDERDEFSERLFLPFLFPAELSLPCQHIITFREVFRKRDERSSVSRPTPSRLSAPRGKKITTSLLLYSKYSLCVYIYTIYSQTWVIRIARDRRKYSYQTCVQLRHSLFEPCKKAFGRFFSVI